jgi:hypothetical protein
VQRPWSVSLASIPIVLLALVLIAPAARAAAPVRPGAPAHPAAPSRLEESRIYIEYNSTDNDLGFHVALDGEDWRTMSIVNPDGRTIFDVAGRGPYARHGLTELFFEGAEPTLDEVPLSRLLSQFPEGRYHFEGVTVDGRKIAGVGVLTHAVPAGPEVSALVSGGGVVIQWEPVNGVPDGFPQRDIEIAGYQVIVAESFQVTVPASETQVTLPREFVESLGAGTYGYEVLAIETGGNQTITAATFDLP